MKQQNDERIEKRFLTVRELAEYLRISISNAYRLIKEPGFPSVRVLEDRWIIPKDKLDQWIEERVGE